ncbi:MAG: DUF1501 domain-containing protein [Bacteroidetes bacterium]|nr:DUF1501 domain-containing protein [Bacteroidota bacterium]
MKRRSFLKALPLGVAATAVPFVLGSRRAEAFTHSPILNALANSNTPDDRALVVIYLEGGNDGLNTLVPFEDPLYDRYRKNLGFTTPEEKARLTFKPRPDLGINPYANALQPLWDEGKIAMVQGIGIENPDLSHFRGLEIWNSSSDADLIIPTGWLGRYLDTLYPDYPNSLPEDPVAINMGTFASQVFRGVNAMMDVQVPDPLTFGAAANMGTQPVPATWGGRELDYVRSLVNIANVYSARFKNLFPAKTVSKVQYPSSQFATDLQHIAWCINAGLKTKIYFASLQGWDTHFFQYSKDDSPGNGHAYLLRTLTEGLAAFQRDLEAMGNADRVVTMTYSEFGRRVDENGDWASGTDHGTAAPHFVIGTNVNGELYGNHPDLSKLDKNGDQYNQFEFRQMFAAVLGDWLGVDESLRTFILSPGRSHAPWDITFPVNGSGVRQHLIDPSKSQQSSSVAPTLLAKSLRLSPNPAMRETAISFVADGSSSDVWIELFDERGRSLRREQRSVGAGEARCTIDVSALANGTYYVQLRYGSQSESAKLVVAR